MDKQELREQYKEIVREFYWFSSQHPIGSEMLNLETLTETIADQILALYLPVKLERLTDEEISELAQVFPEGCTGRVALILINKQVDKIKEINPGITFEEE